MNRTKIKKFFIFLFLILYVFSFYLNQYFYLLRNLFFSSVYAKERIVDKTNLAVILVDSSIYSQLQNYIRWYAVDYIQKNFSNTKAVVIPIDKNNFKARDIVKILENIYFD
jgi:hypothetical protein